MGTDVAAGSLYSKPVAYVFIFNLFVGAGLLTIPYSFHKAGVVLATLYFYLVGVLSYMSMSMVVECQAAANFLLSNKELGPLLLTAGGGKVGEIQHSFSTNATVVNDDSDPVSFAIERRVEFGHMVELFMGKAARLIFTLILSVYLYGDLAIYAVAIPTSMATATLGTFGGDAMVNGTVTWGTLTLSGIDVYRIYVAIFAVVVIPWAFFNFQSTTFLQYFTVIGRNVAIIMMLVLSLRHIILGKGAPLSEISYFKVSGMPEMFGIGIYAWMCHHSLPGLITPIENKKGLNILMFLVYLSVGVYYSALGNLGTYAYGDSLKQLLTINFVGTEVRGIYLFLNLYPVFTLTTSFPLLNITLRNNLEGLFGVNGKKQKCARPFFALLASVPSIAIAMATTDVQFLVNITGGLAGIFVMFTFPALVVMFARRKIAAMPITAMKETHNPHRSPFNMVKYLGGRNFWSIVVLLFSVFALVFIGVVEVKNIIHGRHHRATQ